MNNNSLSKIYEDHCGKVSDKWSSYLTEYNRIFANHRNKPICLLEIGVQNGGSLEIWSKYFENATSLIGCDNNSECLKLTYDNLNIQVVNGDATNPAILERIVKLSKNYDIIIDDGSHKSGDIIKSFALYFPILKNGGLYIIEDLHCSYWEAFDGGLFDPNSSLSFFKLFIDVINQEHWEIPLSKADIFRSIFLKYEINIPNEILSKIHSIEFVNSMCIIRKEDDSENGIGYRVISGLIEKISTGYLDKNREKYQKENFSSKSRNAYHHKQYNIEEIYDQFHLDLQSKNATQIINNLTAKVSEDATIIENLRKTISEQRDQIYLLNKIIDNYHSSISWRLTKPIRAFAKIINKLYY